MKRFLIAVLILAMCISLLISCDTQTTNEQKNTPTVVETDVNEQTDLENIPEDSHVYPDLDGGGEDFTFLNTSTDWGFYTNLVLEAMTGEVLDDAIYARNRVIEEKFNISIKEVPVLVDSSAKKLRTTVQAGEDIYDAAYIPCDSPVGTLVADNLLYNLNDMPGLNLDSKWWNQSVMKDSVIGSAKNLYFAFCDMNIMPLQCAWCIYINEDMIKNLGLELPYSLVKNGKWTYDEFYKYMKAGAQLNGGAESFKWENEGPAIYGYTSFNNGTLALMTASGERGVAVDNGGMPYLAVESERFFNVCDKLAEILSTKDQGEYLTANTLGTPFHFEAIFRNCRALMMGGELKAADSFRNMEDTYGIVPNPKYDELQDRYYTAITIQVPVLVVPVTNTNPERTGAVLDAMAYLSNRDITPVFFDITMSQKRLSNEESIDMLHIIKDSLFFDIGIAYGWTQNIVMTIRDSLDSGKGSNTASVLEKQRDKTLVSINQTMELIEQK